MDRDHAFGGEWTSTKLAILEKYLKAYNTALKDQPFLRFYIDAFAGSGYIGSSSFHAEAVSEEAEDPDATSLKEGSAQIALRVVPSFHRFVFIEKRRKRCASLEDLKAMFPSKARDIEVLQGDANTHLRTLCERDWIKEGRRAVLFLDPYGMQVEWKTLEAVAATRAFDVWILFSHSGANRMLLKTGNMPDAWESRLDLVFGTRAWKDEFYGKDTQSDLFDAPGTQKIADLTSIARYYRERLRTIFAGVSDGERVLRNSHNSPLFTLHFACGNERGKRVALKIANDLLKKW